MTVNESLGKVCYGIAEILVKNIIKHKGIFPADDIKNQSLAIVNARPGNMVFYDEIESALGNPPSSMLLGAIEVISMLCEEENLPPLTASICSKTTWEEFLPDKFFPAMEVFNLTTKKEWKLILKKIKLCLNDWPKYARHKILHLLNDANTEYMPIVMECLPSPAYVLIIVGMIRYLNEQLLQAEEDEEAEVSYVPDELNVGFVIALYFKLQNYKLKIEEEKPSNLFEADVNVWQKINTVAPKKITIAVKK